MCLSVISYNISSKHFHEVVDVLCDCIDVKMISAAVLTNVQQHSCVRVNTTAEVKMIISIKAVSCMKSDESTVCVLWE